MIELKTPTGQTIRVADDRVEDWEARGYLRADQPTPRKPAAKKAPAKKAAAKRSGKKSDKK